MARTFFIGCRSCKREIALVAGETAERAIAAHRILHDCEPRPEVQRMVRLVHDTTTTRAPAALKQEE